MTPVGEFEEETLLTIPGDRARTGDLRPDAEASLIVLNGESAGTRVPVGTETSIGRGSECGLRISKGDISRVHARVTRNRDGSYVLEDLGSRNGTTVDGVPIRRHMLRVGERIRFGTSTVVLFTHLGDLQDQILHQQKLEALGRLAGGVAHDFNNLLGAVLSNVSYLLEDFDTIDRTEARSTLEDIQSAATRAAELTRQLLGFARKGKYEHAATDVNALVEDVLNIVSRTIDPGIRVTFDKRPDSWVLGDRSQLHQVLLNLCINARDALPEGGRIAVRIDHHDDNLIIEVIDNGEGMSPEVRERVFEPFFTTKELGRGTGLGLATAYGVVKNHGGDILVESEVGRGSTFRVYLPRHAVEPDTTPRRRPAKTPVTRGTILVVDDEDLHRRGCARILRGAGYDVLMAQDGPEALRVYESHKTNIDVVLLDLRMPKMSGDEVAHHLVDLDPDVCIVATSGYTDARRAGSILDGLSAGFLRKPYPPGALEDSMRRAMQSRSPIRRAG